MGKIKGWCEKRKMGAKISIKEEEERNERGWRIYQEDTTNTDKFRTNGK